MGLVRAVCERAVYIEHGAVQNIGASRQVIDIYNQTLEKRRIENMSRSDGESAGMGGGVEITQLDILDAEGRPVVELFGDRSVEVRIHYAAYRDIGKANALVNLHRSDGLSVCLMRTHLDQFQLNLNRGQGIISVKIDPLQLFGGLYYATAWMMDDQDANGLAYGASDWFEVKNRTAGRETHATVFEPFRQWSHSVSTSNSMDNDHLTETQRS